MDLARRELGALTRALQRCLPRRTPSLKLQCDAVARRLFELILGGFVEVVVLEAVQMAGRECIEGDISVRSEGTRETRREVGACKARTNPARPSHRT